MYSTAMAQTSSANTKGWFRMDTLFVNNGKTQITRPAYSYEWIDTEVKDSDATGKGVTVQNSLPRGGLGYSDPTGRSFGYAIFWSRVINETATPLELTIHFPADLFAIFPQSDRGLWIMV
jgi:hypothetical protein